MIVWAASVLVLAGCLLLLLAALGIVRMPDFYMRMHAATKAPALALALVLGGLAVYTHETAAAARAVAIIGFLFLTLPVGGHMLARAAHSAGVPLWVGTVADELREARQSQRPTDNEATRAEPDDSSVPSRPPNGR